MRALPPATSSWPYGKTRLVLQPTSLFQVHAVFLAFAVLPPPFATASWRLRVLSWCGRMWPVVYFQELLPKGAWMGDTLYIGIALAFFLLTLAVVRVMDRL